MKFLVFTLLSAIFVFLSEAQLQCPADKYEEWTYRNVNGKKPEQWGQKYPMCYGSNQSPIEIDSELVELDENLAQMSLENYDTPVSKASIKNNGHSVEIRPEDDEERTIEVNGETYSLSQLHFHWGYKYSEGSEHVIDGEQYAMEMHLVHLTQDQKIAVVGIFFQEQLEDNEDLQPIVEQLSNVKYKGTQSELERELDLGKLLPANPTSFYRYDGSLTTPGCAEGVTWSVVPQPMPVGKKQMMKFRELSSTTEEKYTIGCTMAGNYRPTQPLNTRQVYISA